MKMKRLAIATTIAAFAGMCHPVFADDPPDSVKDATGSPYILPGEDPASSDDRWADSDTPPKSANTEEGYVDWVKKKFASMQEVISDTYHEYMDEKGTASAGTSTGTGTQ